MIVSQGADGSIANDRYRIIGISASGDEIGDRLAFYLHIKDAQELLVLDRRVHEIAITVEGIKKVEKLTAVIAQEINNSDLAVDHWKIFARSFYMAMKADVEGMWITLLIIVVVIAVGVLNTVLMLVLERRREYGVLKAIGTRPRQIVRLVLMEVNILGLFSVCLGLIVGFFVNLYLSNHGITLSEPFTYGGIKFQHLMSEINFRMFYIPAITVIFSATLVSLFPAVKAAKTEPAKTMRMY